MKMPANNVNIYNIGIYNNDLLFFKYYFNFIMFAVVMLLFIPDSTKWNPVCIEHFFFIIASL